MSDEADLVGTAEIAAMLGVSRQRVLVLAKQKGFPPPLARLSMGGVWSGPAVRRWIEQRAKGSG